MPTNPDTVFTNVESVVPDPSGNVLLGVSVAVQPGTIATGDSPCVARPWTWTGIPLSPGIVWTVFGRVAAGASWQPIPSSSVTVRPVPTDPNESSWGTIVDALKKTMSLTANLLAAGPPVSNSSPPQHISLTNSSFQPNQQEDLTAGQKWVSMLLNLAAAPYPIPEKLQLTCFLDLLTGTKDPTTGNQYTQFVALPTFHADKDYIPFTQPSSNADYWDIPDVNGIKMHSEFSTPDMGSLVPKTLWLPSAQTANQTPLVSNWQAHLYELLGPYLDVAHVLTSPAYDSPDLYNFPSRLQAAVGTVPSNWTLFRNCVLQALYTLVAPPVAPGATPAPAPTVWAGTLHDTLSSVLNPMPTALSANPVDSESFDIELADMRRIVAAACTGTSLRTLVDKFPNNPVPASFVSADKDPAVAAQQAPALLSFLQARLATAYTPLIAIAANAPPQATVPPTPSSTQDLLNAVLQNLLQNVIRANLQTELNSAFPALSALPAALGAVCFPAYDPNAKPPIILNPSRACHDDLFGLALGTSQPSSTPALTASAPPLVLPAVKACAADNTGKAVDPLRGIRGVSVLLRRVRTKPTPWTCPGIVSPVIQYTDQTTKKVVTVSQTDLPLLVAARLVYDRGLMTGSMLYNNGPLPCANLLHTYMDPGDRLFHLPPGDPNAPPGTPDPSAIQPSVLQYASYEGGGRLPIGTAGLRAGASYEFVTFAISNSGALPVEIRDTTYPARFKPLPAAQQNGAPVPLPTGIQSSKVSYFRTVPVAGLDTCDEKGIRLKNTSTFFPVIPANVWPQATDTVTLPGGEGIAPRPQLDGPPPHLPLLLLTPNDSKHPSAARTTPNFKFSVRLPSVDPQTWLTTAGYAIDPDDAGVVLDWAYTLQKKQLHAPITDPLITSVDFTLYRWQNPIWTPASAPVTYTKAELTQGTDVLCTVQTLPIAITADTGGTNGVSFSVLKKPDPPRIPQATAGTGNFTFQPGEVYLLEARLQLKLDGPDGVSMMPGYAPGHATTDAGSGPSIAGYQLLIEVGSTAMPVDLIKPLSLNLLPLGGIPDQQIQFCWAANGPDWQNVHRVDFLRQMWRWTGRTQPAITNTGTPGDLPAPQFFPAPPPDKHTDPAVVAAWELIEFAERPPADHIESLSTFKAATAKDPAAFQFTLDLSLDPRATYLRVAPRIFSRYQGLYPDTSWSVVSTIDVPENAHWARKFVRSRARTLKMPRLKALLPLTESAFAPGTPGILAVFDGPAYDQAGLAERLTVDFATVADPDLSGKTWTQAGPDALAGATPTLSTPEQQRIPKLIPIGPIGHTADSLSGLDHKFLSHSYIIRPDPADLNAKQDFSWWFAALRFKLSTETASTVFTQPIVSEATFGSWIQFLPGFQTSDTHQADLFDGWTFSVDTSTARPRQSDGTPGGGQTFTLSDAAHHIQTPGVQTSHLTPFLMINRIVLDIAGVEREDYFGVAVHSGQGYILLAGSDWNSVTKAKVRVMQTREGVATTFANHAEFWQSVVGKASEQFSSDQRRTVPVNLSGPIKAAPVK